MLGGVHDKIGEGEGGSEQRGGRYTYVLSFSAFLNGLLAYRQPGKVSEAVVKCAECGPAICNVLLDSVCSYRSRGREKATES